MNLLMNKKILILNTGGTISSVKTQNGYEPAQGYVIAAMSVIPALRHHELPHYHITEYNPLIDSSNITPENWNMLAQNIFNEYNNYAGFIIFHGTDTMAYTAAALSFMLANLNKPVIITGSQIPLAEIRNDAIDNIITSLWLCAHAPINEVCVYFNQHLLRGNRVQKINAQSFNAFDSPNYPHLATIGMQIKLNQQLLLPKSELSLQIQTLTTQLIANFWLFPGFSTAILAALLQQPLQALILETYGTGNAPNNNPEFLNLLQQASNKGIIIVNCTQCMHGTIEMHEYATGNSLLHTGIISGYDMTRETIYCKLLYLLSQNISVAEMKQLMLTNLRGELTIN